MKKKCTVKRLAALLLALVMALSLLPAAALAEEATPPEITVTDPVATEPNSADKTAEPDSGEEPAEEPEQDETEAPAEEPTDAVDFDLPALFSTEVPGDAALTNTWTQDPLTIAGGEDNDAIAEVRDGALYLQAGSANKNNGDATPPPALFVNATMNDTFKKLYDDDNWAIRSFEMDVTPAVVNADGHSGTNICFGIYLNYLGPAKGLFIGYNTQGGWFWQQYGDGNGNKYANFNGPALTPGKTFHLSFQQWGSHTAQSTDKPTHYDVYIDGAALTSGGFNTIATAIGDSQAIGFKVGNFNGERTGVTIRNAHYSGQANDARGYSVTGKVSDPDGKPVKGASVAVNGKSYITDAEGVYTIGGANSLVSSTYTFSVSKDEYYTATKTVKVVDADLTGQDVKLEPIIVNTATLSTADMDVLVDADFPRVIRYDMKGDNAGKVMYGQVAVLDTVTINGVDVVPTVESTLSDSGDRISYTMAAKGADIDCVIHAELVAEGETLSFNINSIDNNLNRLDYPVERISIPKHSLVSVRSTQAGANFIGNRLAPDTTVSGDFRYAANQFADANNQRFIYGFVSNDELSAGMSSNSEWGTSGAASNNWRVLANAEDRAVYTSLGLSSSEWYYDRKMSSSDHTAAQNAPIAYKDSVMGPTELPLYVKVVVTGDKNGDGAVDWQDGAIAARDTIVYKPFNSGEVPELVTTRIAMNFGSQAQNPFLTTLDNVKRVYLNTDGLGQSILLKGYASEGHDSGHPDYANVGRRMGGVPDMLTMMKDGAELGARFGIHVNADEFYPEAQAFSSKMIRRNDDGSLHYGWNWLDQGVGINGLYDLASGNRAARFNALGDEMNGLLDFVYVDVWGNNTSGTEDAWQTRKLDKEITGNGWRMANEWAFANERESTFQHWVADYGYGNYSDKGKYNSEVERFLLNSSKDSFAADFPHYGGYANAPLLGGCVTQGFEGWQGDGEYNQSIESIFEHMIPSKFLQHYDIMKWTDANNAVTLPYGAGSGDAPDHSSSWTPEAQVALQNYDRSSTVMVTRGSDEEINGTYAYGTAEEKQEYRSRTISLDGKVILKGAPAPAAGWTSDVTELRGLANQQYLIPWLWDTEGKLLANDDQKLYHRNDLGGESTWALPDGWTSLANVKMYELTDNGRTNETVVPVVNGTVTLDAVAKNPYVLVKGENGAATPAVEWSTGMYLKDVGFNSANITDNWTVTGAGSAVRHLNADQQSVLKMNGAVSVSQEYTGLIPGKTYATYVAVDNRSTAKASMAVTAGDSVLASNYTEKSIAKNYISAYSLSTGHPIEKGSSYFQNMYVFYTAPASGKVTLTLSREAGEGNTYFDDVRTLETQMNNFTYDEDGNVVKFTQNFEHSIQGEYPFVVGPIEGVSDNRQHLSEKHEPYTQAGWDVKKMDDVLDGNWSVKINGLTQRNNLAYQTIPQNFHFESGVTYTVSFDYQMGSAGTYEAVYGASEWGSGGYTAVPLKMSLGTTATCTFTIVGDPNGQTWFGIRSTGTPSNNQGTKGSVSDFGGYKDFVLDNVTIERSSAQKGELAALIATADGMAQGDYSGDWAAFDTARTAAKAVMNNQQANQTQIDGAVAGLKTAMESLTVLKVLISGTVTINNKPAPGVVIEVQNTKWKPQGVKVVTGADGSYTLPSGDLHVMDYILKVTAAGCSVKSVPVTGVVGNESKTVNVNLTAWNGAYAVNFDDEDVSMIAPLKGSQVGILATNKNPEYANPTENRLKYDGTGLWYWLTSGDRAKNNIINKEIQMINGTVSFDVAPLYSDNRFGIVFRGVDGDNRIFVGQFASTNAWGWEYWGTNGSAYSTDHSGPSMGINSMRHLEATLEDNKITLKVDGAVIIDHEPMSNPPASIGSIGFVYGNGLVGCEFLIDNLTIIPSDASVANTYMVNGSVTGTGSTVANAQITILDADRRAVTRTTTGADGSFKTLPIPAGGYTVKASAPGYGTKTAQLTVTDSVVTLSPISLDVDVSQLQALYDANKDKTQDNYTDTSWAAFQDALTQAVAALAAPKADAVAAAYSALTNALTGLAMKPVDKSLLRTYYNSYNMYTGDNYTTDSWAAFQTALKAAGAVLNDDAAKQADVDAACEALVAAEKALTNVSNGSGSSGSSNTTTKTVKNTDGSTTKTMTNKKTGETTATTTYPNGAKIVTTSKDGLSVVTVPSGKASVAVTIPTASKPTPGMVAVIVNRDGGETVIKTSVSTDAGMRVTLVEGATLKLVDKSKTFTDMAANNWAADAVQFATSRELFNGTGTNTFNPTSDMSRAMLVTVLARLDGQDTTTGETWDTVGTAWAKELGISDGTNMSTSITRESLVVMLYRYAKAEGADGTALSKFPDANQVSDWAAEAMSWAVANGIIAGKSGNVLDSQGTASRAEVAAMLQRFVENMM